jgi:hypothetical protein
MGQRKDVDRLKRVKLAEGNCLFAKKVDKGTVSPCVGYHGRDFSCPLGNFPGNGFDANLAQRACAPRIDTIIHNLSRHIS